MFQYRSCSLNLLLADSVSCTPASFTKEVETVTITDTVISTVAADPIMSPCPQDGSAARETQTITVSRMSTTTLIVTQTPDNVIVSQSSQSTETAWTAIAVIFIIISIVCVMLNIVLGCVLYKKRKAMEDSMPGASSKEQKMPIPEGETRRY